MTSKEKAKELVCKMYGCEINTDLNDIYILNGEGYFLAKDCALIAVDLIIEQFNYIVFIDDRYRETNLIYWQEVEKEIENL
jgi:hypothetical protein